MAKQEITVKTTGKWNETKVLIGKQEIDCAGVQISGDDQADLDVSIVLHKSKVTIAEIENALNPAKRLSPAVGFVCDNEDEENEYYEEE